MTAFESTSLRHLLPSGFPDYVYPLSETRYFASQALTKHFIQHGYVFTKPPLIEYAENLAADDIQRRGLFRMTDPLSRETIAIRSDMTRQICRIAGDVLCSSNPPQLPLRLCYAGPVAAVMPEQSGGLREQEQVGAEYIGGTLLEGVTEVIEMLLHNVRKFGIKQAVLDIGFPELVRKTVRHLRLDEKDEQIFRHALTLKDKATIDAYIKRADEKDTCPSSAWLTGLAHRECPESDRFPAVFSPYLEMAAWIMQRLQPAFPEITFRIDPSDVNAFPYHKDIVFSLYAEGSSRELARGGHYTVGGYDAVGATLYVEDVCNAAPDLPASGMDFVLAPRKLAYRRVATLVREGYRVVYAPLSVDTLSAIKEEAMRKHYRFYCSIEGELHTVPI